MHADERGSDGEQEKGVPEEEQKKRHEQKSAVARASSVRASVLGHHVLGHHVLGHEAEGTFPICQVLFQIRVFRVNPRLVCSQIGNRQLAIGNFVIE